MIKPRRIAVDRSEGIPLSIVSRLLFPEALNSESRLGSGVVQYLQAGDLLGYGVLRGKSRRDLIERELWGGLNIDLSTSYASDQGGRQFDGVVIFPVLQSPDAIQQIAGRSLREIFQRFVRLDPLVAAMGDIATKSLPGWRDTVMRGLPAYDTALWPVRYEDWDFVKPTPEVSRAGAEFMDRYRALVNILRSRRAVVTGVNRAGSEVVVNASIWSDEIVRVDFNGPFLFADVFSAGDVLHSLTVNLPDGVQGLPDYHPIPAPIVSKASDERATESWLDQQIRAAGESKPAPKEEMLARAQKEFPDLPKRAFERVWAKAAVKYPRLTAKGRPKKPR